jgi:hypothetical protein
LRKHSKAGHFKFGALSIHVANCAAYLRIRTAKNDRRPFQDAMPMRSTRLRCVWVFHHSGLPQNSFGFIDVVGRSDRLFEPTSFTNTLANGRPDKFAGRVPKRPTCWLLGYGSPRSNSMKPRRSLSAAQLLAATIADMEKLHLDIEWVPADNHGAGCAPTRRIPPARPPSCRSLVTP